MSDIHLKQFEATSFMGISHDEPIIIDFTKARKGQNVVKITGDQGTRKTSTITALMYLLGAAFNIDQKNFKNLQDDNIDLALEFEYNGEKYKAEAKGGRFSLKSLIKEKWVPESQPKELIRKMVGPLGVSPMFLKEMAGKKQIQWFKETFGADEDASKKEQKLIADIDTLFAQRRDVNRDIKNIKGALAENKLFANYETNLVKFKTVISAEKEKAAFDAISEKNKQYEKYEGELQLINSNLIAKHNQINDLEQQLKKAKEDLSGIEKRKTNGEKWLADNKGVKKEFEKANEAWLNLSKSIAEQIAWKDVLKKKKELDESETLSQQADGNLDKLRLNLLKLTKTYLPDIEGLSIKLKTGLDDDEEGIYYYDKTIAQLSESEVWALFVRIWEQKGVQMVFCENVNSLGSDAVAVLNKLAKDGATIFASEMIRKQDEIEFSIQTKID